MKATGIVRKLDRLGRVVIPMELRRVLGININDPLEIFTEGDTIILKKYNPACYFCDNADELVEFQGKSICRDCLARLNRAATGEK